MWRLPSDRSVLLGTAIAIFVMCCLLPVVYLLVAAARDVDILAAVALDERQRGLLYNTSLLGGGTAALSTAIGVPLGIALARVRLPLKNAIRLALVAPLLIPPYIAGLAWTYLGLNRNWEITYSLSGAVLVLTTVFYPLAMVATEVALRRIDGRLEEAALMSAPPARVLRRISLPLAGPSIVAATLMIFVLAISEFGVPGLLQVRVYTTEVFTAFAALYDFSRALLLTAPLILLCGVMSVAAAMLLGDRLVVSRRVAGHLPAQFDEWRTAAVGAAIAVMALAVILPIALLSREALAAQSPAAVLAGSGRAIFNSVMLAGVGATAVVAVAIFIGYAGARATRRLGQSADILFIVLFAVPSTIVGVGLIGLWNRPGWVGTLYGTDAMLLLGYLARFVPVATLALAAGIRQIPRSHEEAAAVSGARWSRTYRVIVLPQIALAVASTWVVVFILAFGELGVSVLVAPPGEATLPIRIYTLIANAPSSHVALLALLQTAVVFVPLAALGAGAAMHASRETR